MEVEVSNLPADAKTNVNTFADFAKKFIDQLIGSGVKGGLTFMNSLQQTLLELKKRGSLTRTNIDSVLNKHKESLASIDSSLSKFIEDSKMFTNDKEEEDTSSIVPTSKLQNAFNQRYLYHPSFSVVDKLYTSLDSMLKEYTLKKDDYLAPYLAIFQSSGYGKSRVIKELSEKCFVIYTSFGDASYPKKSFHANLLVPDEVFSSADSFTMRAVKFLLACCKTTLNYNGKTKEFYDYQIQNPISFTNQVNNNMNEIHIDSKDVKDLKLEDVEPIWGMITKVHGKDVKIIFAFDEARKLLEECSYLEISYFRLIRRTLRSIGRLCDGFGAIFSDTLSKVSNFAPPVRLGGHSLRPDTNEKKPQKLFSPFYKFPTFNLFGFSDMPLKHEFRDEKHLDNLFIRGRPLWGAMKESGAINTNQELVQFGIEKLFGGNIRTTEIQNAPEAEKELIAISAACCRFAVNVSQTSHIASDLVAGYMATCVSISDNRELILVEYPTEPILAEASAKIMANDENYLVIINTLSKYINFGGISPGDRGELITRIIALKSYDDAIRSEPIHSMYSKGVTVENFLKYMFRITNIIDKKNKFSFWETQKYRFYEEDLQGIISFTHFIPREYDIDELTLKEAWSQCAGLVCRLNAECIDNSIPYVINKKDKGPQMRPLNFQVKNRVTGISDDVLASSQDDARIKAFRGCCKYFKKKFKKIGYVTTACSMKNHIINRDNHINKICVALFKKLHPEMANEKVKIEQPIKAEDCNSTLDEDYLNLKSEYPNIEEDVEKAISETSYGDENEEDEEDSKSNQNEEKGVKSKEPKKKKKKTPEELLPVAVYKRMVKANKDLKEDENKPVLLILIDFGGNPSNSAKSEFIPNAAIIRGMDFGFEQDEKDMMKSLLDARPGKKFKDIVDGKSNTDDPISKQEIQLMIPIKYQKKEEEVLPNPKKTKTNKEEDGNNNK